MASTAEQTKKCDKPDCTCENCTCGDDCNCGDKAAKSCCSGSGSCDKDCKKDCCKGGKKECCKGDKKKECCKGKAETCPVPYPYITTAAVVAVVAVAAYAFYKRR